MLQRRNDREEIRRRLAMGEEADRPGGRKPSLQSRLQSGECQIVAEITTETIPHPYKFKIITKFLKNPGILQNEFPWCFSLLLY
jgi:Schwannomin-interacting protein 1